MLSNTGWIVWWDFEANTPEECFRQTKQPKMFRKIEIGKASKRPRKAVASNDKGGDDNLEYDHTVMMNDEEYDDNVIDKVWLEGHENPQESEQDLFAGGLKLAPVL